MTRLPQLVAWLTGRVGEVGDAAPQHADGSECRQHVCSLRWPPPDVPACRARPLVASGSGGHPAAASRLEHSEGKMSACSCSSFLGHRCISSVCVFVCVSMRVCACVCVCTYVCETHSFA